MKTQHIFFCLLQFITCCIITWKAESTLFAVFAYILLVILLSGIIKHLVNDEKDDAHKMSTHRGKKMLKNGYR